VSTATPVKNARRRTFSTETYKIAVHRAELKSVFKLVYHAYSGRGLVIPSSLELRVTPYQILPSTEVFVALRKGEVNCTVSLVRDAELGLPMESIYDEEVAERRRRGIEIAEVSCLADRPGKLKPSIATLFGIMAFTAQCAKRRGVDQLLIAIHPRHVAFYRRFIGFQLIGEMKPYGAVRNHPAVPMSLDLNRLAVDDPQAYERLFGSPFSDQQLAYQPVSHDLRSYFQRYVEAERGVGSADDNKDPASELQLACA